MGKIPISKTSNGVVGICVVDYGDGGNFRLLRDNFSRYHMITISGSKKKKEQSGG